MKKIVIASACRTAIGKFGGTLANVPAAELGSIVIKEALNRANVKPEQVDHVYMGCVIQAGLKAFVAAVLGGIGSIPGAMIGGIAIGLCECFVSAIGLSAWKDAWPEPYQLLRHQ